MGAVRREVVVHLVEDEDSHSGPKTAVSVISQTSERGRLGRRVEDRRGGSGNKSMSESRIPCQPRIGGAVVRAARTPSDPEAHPGARVAQPLRFRGRARAGGASVHAEEASRMREIDVHAIPCGLCPVLGAEDP